jgi:hypothetical protein
MFEISVEISKYDDGTLLVQQLHPNKTLNEFYGKYLGPGQMMKLGVMLLTGSPLLEMLEEEEETPEEIVVEPIVEPVYKKKTIPEGLRWSVWERDNFTCKHCGTRKRLTIDHIYPEVKGGETVKENLQTLCKRCNSKKGTG